MDKKPRKIKGISKKQKSISIRLNDETIIEKFKEIANENGTFINEIYNEALEYYIKKFYKIKEDKK
jgi:hypothetical protein